MKREFETTLSKANIKGASFRTAVPSEIVKLLKLDVGDKVVWDANIKEKNIEIKLKFKKE